MNENPYFVKMEKINSEINVIEKYIYLHIAMKSLIFWHKSLQIAGRKWRILQEIKFGYVVG